MTVDKELKQKLREKLKTVSRTTSTLHAWPRYNQMCTTHNLQAIKSHNNCAFDKLYLAEILNRLFFAIMFITCAQYTEQKVQKRNHIKVISAIIISY